MFFFRMWRMFCTVFRHSAGFHTWRRLSTGKSWRGWWCTGCSWSRSCCPDCSEVSGVVEKRRDNEENDVLVVNSSWESKIGRDMCGPDDRFFSSAPTCYAILAPNACDAFRACEEIVLRCIMGVLSNPSTANFLEFFQETEITTRLPLRSRPLRRCRWRWRRKWRCCWRVSPWLSVIPPFNLAIDEVIEVSSSFELLILSLTLLILWTYRYQLLFCLRQVSILHFQALHKLPVTSSDL